MSQYGPLVPRTARLGGALLAVASFQFIVAMIVVQAKFPGYSDFANSVSALGGPDSPWAWLANDSIRVLAVLGFLGTVLARTAFPAKKLARAGIVFLLLAEVAAFLVGTFPETNRGDMQDTIHAWVSSAAFVASGFALVALGIGTFRDTRWDGYRTYTFVSGLVTFLGIILFASDPGGAGFAGLWERLTIAPVLLWAILAGVHLVRLPAFAPSSPGSG
ncbi:MAG TPA: DUF998 domain-containing protein [Thermoplasmata archaeon]